MRLLFVVDPIETFKIHKDTTYVMMREAQRRGHTVAVCEPQEIFWLRGGLVTAPVRTIALLDAPQEGQPWWQVLTEGEEALAHFDAVLMRKDPPFDSEFFYTTHLLTQVEREGGRVFNHPASLREHPEKLDILEFAAFIGPTLVTRSAQRIRAFHAEHGDIILKPLYGNGGAGVFRLDPNDRNLASLHELFTSINREPMIVQKYVPAVVKGDKRIILVDGEPVGAINRVPAAGETRSNMHVGGRPEPTQLTDRERDICAAIGPTLREKGQIFVGIDVIGDWLTEINVTSPTGIQELERFDGTNVAARIWQVIEAKRGL